MVRRVYATCVHVSFDTDATKQVIKATFTSDVEYSHNHFSWTERGGLIFRLVGRAISLRSKRIQPTTLTENIFGTASNGELRQALWYLDFMKSKSAMASQCWCGRASD